MRNTTELLKKMMGDNMYEALNKALVKLPTSTVVDIQELHSALKSVPKALVSYLVKVTKDLDDKNTAKEIDLPFDDNCKMLINRKGPDVYSGEIYQNGKAIHRFDNTAIPTLAAHVLSLFELYDMPMGDDNSAQQKEQAAKSDALTQAQFKVLESKIDALMALIASQGTSKSDFVEMPKDEFVKEHKKLVDVLRSPSHEDDKEEAKEQSKELKDVVQKAEKLSKKGLMPKMPSPPQPGTKVGGNSGTTQAGILGDKTAHTDYRAKPTTQERNPYMKAPKQQPGIKQQSGVKQKTLTFGKSELKDSKCPDCGEDDFKGGKFVTCSCFKALSKPEIKKNENGSLTLQFKKDWDEEAVSALYRSLKKTRG